MSTRHTIGEGIRFLAGRCDWAVKRDDVGFNGTDTYLGHWLAEVDDGAWTDEMRVAGYEMLRKYRRQLTDAGIEYDLIEDPAPGAPETARKAARRTAIEARKEGERREREARRREAELAERVIDWNGALFAVTFPFDWDLVNAVKAIPGRRWNGSENTIPATPEGAAGLRQLVDDLSFNLTPAARERLDGIEVREALPTHRVEYADHQFSIFFPKDFDIIAIVRGLEGRRFDGDRLCWTIPDNREAVRGLRGLLAERTEFLADKATRERLDAVKAEHAKREREEAGLAELSTAMEASLDVDTPEGLKLREFQKAGVAYALKAKRAFIADDMGTGKTIQALMALKEADAFPAVVAVRATLKRKWRDEVRTWLPDKRVVMLAGTKPAEGDYAGADVIIVNYDILAAWSGVVAKDTVKRGKRAKDEDKPGPLAFAGLRGLVVDESHYVKTEESQRTRATLMLAKTIPADGLVLNLTGTPVLNRPIELAAQLAVLGRLGEYGGYWKYAKRYCAAYRDTYGMDVSGSSNEAELHERLRRSCYIRRTKDQVLPELPEIQVARLPVEIDNATEYRRAEREIIGWVKEQVERDGEFLAEIADLPEDERKGRISARKAEKGARARAAEELVKLNALRRLAARGKVTQAVEWIQDFLDTAPTEKLVVFAHHKDIQLQIGEAFNALRIHADDDEKTRDAQARAFRQRPDDRVIVCSMEAAREGIDLFSENDEFTCANVLFLELGWNAKIHDQAEARIHRIGQKADGVTAWYMLAEGTIDEGMHELIEAKRAVTDAVDSGKASERSVSIARELIDRMKAA